MASLLERRHVNQNFCLYLSNDYGKIMSLLQVSFFLSFSMKTKCNKYFLSTYYVSDTFLDTGEYTSGERKNRQNSLPSQFTDKIYLRYTACLKRINTMEINKAERRAECTERGVVLSGVVRGLDDF